MLLLLVSISVVVDVIVLSWTARAGALPCCRIFTRPLCYKGLWNAIRSSTCWGHFLPHNNTILKNNTKPKKSSERGEEGMPPTVFTNVGQIQWIVSSKKKNKPPKSTSLALHFFLSCTELKKKKCIISPGLAGSFNREVKIKDTTLIKAIYTRELKQNVP